MPGTPMGYVHPVRRSSSCGSSAWGLPRSKTIGARRVLPAHLHGARFTTRRPHSPQRKRCIERGDTSPGLGFPTTRAGAAAPQRGWRFHGHRAPHARFRPPLRLAAAHPCGCGSCDPRTSPSREMGAFLGFALQGVSPTTTRCTLMHAPLLAFALAWPAKQVAPWVGLQGFAIVVDPSRRPRKPKPVCSTTDPFLGFVALQSVLPTVPTPTFRIRGVSLHILAWDDVPSSTWISRSRVTAGSPGPSRARQLS